MHGETVRAARVALAASTGPVYLGIPTDLLTAPAPVPGATSPVAETCPEPQLDTALEIYDRAVADGDDDSIDTASLLRRYGHTLFRVEGPRSNIKITTAEDFYICRAFFDVLERNQIGG